ncbi:MAG: sigma-70 family RNA polymerase sigma factor [Dehalococcoidia bacterium]|nr:sigma-70 family RNA polymerase sigma factor [Dehalococcoidia bacterium]
MTGPESLALTVRSGRDEHADSDDALVRAALTESTAFGLLYERYYDRVYRYCRARMPGHEESADLAQQVFVRAFDNLHRFRPRGSTFAAWLFRIAHNLVVDVGRRKHHGTIPWDAVPEIAMPATPDIGPEDAALRTEQLEQLRRAVNALPPDSRDLLVLRFGVGLSIKEIATVIGKSVSATQMRLSRTLAAIRKDY